MFLAPGTLESSRILPELRSIAPSRKLPKLSVSIEEEKRSVENTSVRPSGDQEGCRSANGSFVSGRTVPESRSRTCRSLNPPLSPENAIRRPSGDHVGL